MKIEKITTVCTDDWGHYTPSHANVFNIDLFEFSAAILKKGLYCFHGMATSAWLLKLSDFQRNLCFGSKIADRVVDLKEKADFLSILSFVLCRLYSTNYVICDYTVLS